MKLSTLLALTAAGFTTVGNAQTVRDLDSHEHGSAILNVAVDINALFLELETPWNNLVGFEHEPGTDGQYAMVKDAWGLLNEPERLFTLNDGNCTVNEVRVESGMPIEPHDDDHADHKDGHHNDAHDDEKDEHHDDAHSDEKDEHHDDAHSDEKDDHHDDAHSDGKDDHHDDAHGDEKDDHHAHEHQDEETHSTALATYGYTCSDIAQLSSITVNVFTLWSGFEELDVQLIGPGGQTSVELTAGETTINLKEIQ